MEEKHNIPLTSDQTEFLNACNMKLRLEEAYLAGRLEGFKSGVNYAVNLMTSQVLRAANLPVNDSKE